MKRYFTKTKVNWQIIILFTMNAVNREPSENSMMTTVSSMFPSTGVIMIKTRCEHRRCSLLLLFLLLFLSMLLFLSAGMSMEVGGQTCVSQTLTTLGQGLVLDTIVTFHSTRFNTFSFCCFCCCCYSDVCVVVTIISRIVVIMRHYNITVALQQQQCNNGAIHTTLLTLMI